MCYDILLCIVWVIIECQVGFLICGEEVMVLLILKEVVDVIGMYEFMVLCIIIGKYLQILCGMLELKYFFVVWLEGVSVFGQVVKVMVWCLIDVELVGWLLVDEVIVGLLLCQGVNIVCCIVVKYCE